MSLLLTWIADFVNIRREACHPVVQADESNVTVPEVSVTSKIPEWALRKEFT